MHIWSDDTSEIHHYRRSVIFDLDAPRIKAPERYSPRRPLVFKPTGLTAEWGIGSEPKLVTIRGVRLTWIGDKDCEYIYYLGGSGPTPDQNAPEWIEEIFNNERV